jgi:aspartyl/glutamyl-tRNA(Asn/Gln) amidotransferase C subunit
MIDVKEIEKLVFLSRMELAKEEKEAFVKEIVSILDYVSRIKEVSENLQSRPGGDAVKNVLREDEEEHPTGIYTEKLLSQVPEREEDFVRVKKIIQHD